VGRVHARLRLALIAMTVCAAAAVAGVTLATRQQPASQPAVVNGWAGAIRPPGAHVPDFRLTDQHGRSVSSASLRGKPTVYAFVYSTCRDTCPAQVQTIRGALDDTGADVHVVGISVDPANDTPKLAETFLLEQSMTGRMRFLLGTRAQLEPVWKAFGIQPQTKALEHSAHIVLADAQGLQRIGFPFDHLTQEGLAHDMAKLAAR
jgi:protein SCO1/2